MNVIEPNFLLQAYSQGIFPMGMPNGEIGWFSPDPRGIIPIDTFHIPHGLKRFLKKSPYTVRVDTCFRDVMLGCADRKETWIDDTVLESYCTLHRLGFAHSVETWEADRLIGGLYGLSIGGAFFGESMFSRKPNASSTALTHLVGRLRERDFVLLDTQWTTPHLRSFGAIDISRNDYLRQLKKAISLDRVFSEKSHFDS